MANPVRPVSFVSCYRRDGHAHEDKFYLQFILLYRFADA